MARVYVYMFFAILSLLALFVVTYDYTSGHTFEEEMSLEYCPICESFNSAIKVLFIVIALNLLGRIVLLGIACMEGRAVPASLSRTPFSLRAPPIAHI